MNDKILTIFGGSGFIASELVYKLSEHFKEYLEEQDKPTYHMEERQPRPDQNSD